MVRCLELSSWLLPCPRGFRSIYLDLTSRTSTISSKVALGGSSKIPFSPYPCSGLLIRIERCEELYEWVCLCELVCRALQEGSGELASLCA
jgi:hypothetical protein